MIPETDRELAAGVQPGSVSELLQAILRSNHRQEELLMDLQVQNAQARDAKVKPSSKPKASKE